MRRAVPLCVSVLVLGACGGGGDPAEVPPPPSVDVVLFGIVDEDVPGRVGSPDGGMIAGHNADYVQRVDGPVGVVRGRVDPAGSVVTLDGPGPVVRVEPDSNGRFAARVAGLRPAANPVEISVRHPDRATWRRTLRMIRVDAGCGEPTRAGRALPPEPQVEEPRSGAPGTNDASGGKKDISIEACRFDPPVMRVGLGQITVWTNKDGEAHSVRAVGRALPRSGAIPPGGRYDNTAIEPGRYEYFCVLHPRMRGTVEVAAEPAPYP